MLGPGRPMEIIVTDLTRFANEDVVCMAGIDRASGECIRPLPYLEYNLCRRLGLLPGAVLVGGFARRSVARPHTEDRHWQGRRAYRGWCGGQQFKSVLESTESRSVEEGFSTSLEPGQKYFPLDTPPPVSIITLSVSPLRFRIVPDLTKPGRIRAIFSDRSGREFHHVSITDLGFYDYTRAHLRTHELARLNHFVHTQEQLYLRLGLSREHHAPDGRAGYWLQVNGIYTFPSYLKQVRSYEPAANHAP